MSKNIIYAQSGGVTAVINAQACGVIQTALQHSNKDIGQIYVACNGILGILHEDLLRISNENAEQVAGLLSTPGGAFGSCRYKLKSSMENSREFERILQVFRHYDIGYFFYNGGGDSQDTTNKIAQYCDEHGFPVVCIGVPKTIDNDLAVTDNCPGFGSVAKYVAISMLEAGLDVRSMALTSTKVFILEVMGRHAGWIAAAAGLAAQDESQAPHMILFPERVFDQKDFCRQVAENVARYGYCAIAASEGIKDTNGIFVAESGSKDAFGHSQLGGVAPKLANIVQQELGFKVHWAVSDYLQRAARHIASQVDVDQAYATGKAAVEFALQGKNGVMPIIVRESGAEYKWKIEAIELQQVANIEKTLPADYISDNGYRITDKCREYLLPLIKGEAYPSYENGLPNYVREIGSKVVKKLSAW